MGILADRWPGGGWCGKKRGGTEVAYEVVVKDGFLKDFFELPPGGAGRRSAID